MKWTSHISDLKGWSSEPAQIYSINSIPFNYLLDANGIIIAKNLRGANLDTELDNILNGITGLNENYYSSENQITIYPNPTTGLITVTGLPQEATRITVYNVLGKLMHSQELTGLNEPSVNLSVLPTGLYFIQLQYGGMIIRKKVIKR